MSLYIARCRIDFSVYFIGRTLEETLDYIVKCPRGVCFEVLVGFAGQAWDDWTTHSIVYGQSH